MRSPKLLASAAALCTTLVTLLSTVPDANAGGLFFSDRGVRPVARGGAFVAGADDFNAICYNAAGLADAPASIAGDFAWLNYASSYTRKTRIVDADGAVRYYESPTVQGSTPFLPIPTLAGIFKLGEKKQFTGALGIFAPYTAITSFPETVNGQPASSRYSLVTLDGSALVVAGAYFAYKPVEQFRIGAGLQMLAGTFKSVLYMNANPNDRLIGAPEDPSYDALAVMNVGPIFSPTGTIGMTGVPTKWLRLGLSFQLPTWINAPGKLSTRLPTAAIFANARQEGNEATISFRIPAVLRAGVEVRPNEDLRIEFDYVREFWSLHDDIMVKPTSLKLYDVTGFPSPYSIGNIQIPRNFQDSNSFRLGGEYDAKVGSFKIPLRIGAQYETSAIPTAWVSPLTFDSSKFILGFGAGIHLSDHWRLDATYARVIAESVEVSPDQAKVPRINPVAGNPTGGEAINGGTYSAYANILGLGAQYAF